MRLSSMRWLLAPLGGGEVTAGPSTFRT